MRKSRNDVLMCMLAAAMATEATASGAESEDVVPNFECEALRSRQALEAKLIAQLFPLFGDTAEAYVLGCLRQIGYPASVNEASRESRIPTAVSAAASEWRQLCAVIDSARIAAIPAEDRAREEARLAERAERGQQLLRAFKKDIQTIGAAIYPAYTVCADWTQDPSAWSRACKLQAWGVLSLTDLLITSTSSPGAAERAEAVERSISMAGAAHSEAWRTIRARIRAEGGAVTSARVSPAFNEARQCIESVMRALPTAADDQGNQDEGEECAAIVRMEVCNMKDLLDAAGAAAVVDRIADGGSVDWTSGSVGKITAGKHSSWGRGLCLYGGGDRAVD
jgi:hypothetical protein